jgi:hypothetical protein
MEVCGMKIWLYALLIWALDGGEWTVSRSSHIALEETKPEQLNRRIFGAGRHTTFSTN